jgi:hypothetical protein
MQYEPVDVFVLGVDALGTPIAGVLVRAYSADNTTLFAEAVTDNVGHAGFLLPAPATYYLRLYKYQSTFSQPVQLDVLSDVATPGTTPNVFNVRGAPPVQNPSNDARFCRASGYFRNIDGSPADRLEISFTAKFNPLIADGFGIYSGHISVCTDESGYAEVELLRCALYSAVLSNSPDKVRDIRVPDMSATNLPDLLYPRVYVVSFAESAPYSLSVGSTLELTPTIVDTAGVPIPGVGPGDVRWTSSDPTIMSVLPGQTTVSVRGLRPGSAQVLVQRVDASVINIPNLPILGAPLDFTIQ